MTWRVEVYPHPVPERAVADPRCAELLRYWARYVGPVEGVPDADFEDWVEQAARLQAAVDEFEPSNCRVAVHGRDDGDPEHRPRYGSRAGGLHGPPDLADGYGATATFAAAAGRHVEVVDTAHLRDRVRALAAEGHGRLVVKAVEAKTGLWTLATPPGTRDIDDAVQANTPRGTSDAQAVEDARSAFGWSLVLHDGKRGAYLVQDWVHMACEYRLFVVDGRPVTGAGCIEDRTPLDRSDGAFDPLVEAMRGSGTPRRADTLVAEYVDFGWRVAASLAEEVPALTEYALDVALGGDGPLVVELNGLDNAGLYACDPHRITRALARRRATC